MTAGSIAVLADEEGILVSAGTRLSFSAYQAEEIMAALCLLETPHVAAFGPTVRAATMWSASCPTAATCGVSRRHSAAMISSA